MATTSFPRFLDLPKELQVQIWEHALVDMIGQFASKHSPRSYRNFGTKLGDTITLLIGEGGAKARVHVRGRVTSLALPPFCGILGASRMVRLVACQWWKRLLEGCITDTMLQGFYEEIRAKMVGDLEEIIADLSSKLAAEEADSPTQSSSLRRALYLRPTSVSSFRIECTPSIQGHRRTGPQNNITSSPSDFRASLKS